MAILNVGSFLLVVSWLCARGAAASYNAAVFEFTPDMRMTQATRAQAETLMQANLADYDKWLTKAQTAFNGALDIAVFPEDGLYGPLMYNRSFILPYAESMPSVSAHVALCRNRAWSHSPTLTEAACLAVRHNTYLVLDMAEQVGTSLVYNTQVAFDRHGVLVAKYHKSHLYFEPQFNVSAPPEPVFFDADFGVRFALMICFDVMFKEPQTTLKTYMGPPHFIYSSWWVNKSPLINALQTQSSWASLFNKTLLASGAGYNSRSSGSGIYQNNTVLASYYNPTGAKTSQMLVAKVVNDQSWHCGTAHPAPMGSALMTAGQQRRQQVFLGAAAAPQMRPFVVNRTSLARGQSGVLSASDGSTSCFVRFTNAMPDANAEQYGLLALDGNYNGLLNVSVCAFVRCTSPNCRGFTLTHAAHFDQVHLNGMFARTPLSPLTFGTGPQGTLIPVQTTTTATQTVVVATSATRVLGLTIWGLHF